MLMFVMLVGIGVALEAVGQCLCDPRHQDPGKAGGELRRIESGVRAHGCRGRGAEKLCPELRRSEVRRAVGGADVGGQDAIALKHTINKQYIMITQTTNYTNQICYPDCFDDAHAGCVYLYHRLS